MTILIIYINFYIGLLEYLKKNDIPYWASGGTFLGAIRCKGIIKWDDDLDLCVLYQDRDKLKKVIDQENDIYFGFKFQFSK